MSSSNLPPSTEDAYRKKCIELRRRMIEVEENNDATRLRRARLVRGIRKMRIERAILLDSLSKRMRKNGTGGTVFDEDSDDSIESPPTPNERPLRIKKPHRRLPEMSSPVIPPTIPSASFQTPISNLPTPISGPGVQNDPFATTSEFTKADLYPPSNPAELFSDFTSPHSAFDLFAEHLLINVLSRHAMRTKEDTDFTVQETWDTLPDEIRKAWDMAEQTTRSHIEKAKAAEEWKRTVGNRSRSIGVKPADPDDEDVIMVGADDVQRR